MLSDILLITVFVVVHLIFFAIAWNQVPDETNISDPEREAALMDFYHP